MIWEELSSVRQRPLSMFSHHQHVKNAKYLLVRWERQWAIPNAPHLKGSALEERICCPGRRTRQAESSIPRNKSPVIISAGYKNSGIFITFYVCYFFIICFPLTSQMQYARWKRKDLVLGDVIEGECLEDLTCSVASLGWRWGWWNTQWVELEKRRASWGSLAS